MYIDLRRPSQDNRFLRLPAVKIQKNKNPLFRLSIFHIRNLGCMKGTKLVVLAGSVGPQK